MALVQPAAISHWSALSHHGLTEQAPRRVFVLTSARTVPRLRGVKAEAAEGGYPVGAMIYQFVQVKPERFFGTEEVWVNESRIKITDPERTLLDGLMDPQYCGDFAEVLHAFEVRAPKLDLERIIHYALKPRQLLPGGHACCRGENVEAVARSVSDRSPFVQDRTQRTASGDS
jgi:predicted transcriptional regulator of viral defense system